MIYSMTGFASVARDTGEGRLSIELRAVNHRYLDVQFRIPDDLRNLEPALREAIAARLTRGKVECRVGYAPLAGDLRPARLNAALLRQIARWNGEVREVLPDARTLTVGEVLRWDGVLENTALSEEALGENVLELARRVLDDFTATRGREGERLAQHLLQRVAQIEALCAAAAPRIPAAIKLYEEKIAARLREALQGGEEERVRQEVALFASKIDVDEELSRLQTHLAEIRRILDMGGAVGKRLDFLMQELNREANTLGSKSVDAEISRTSVEMKILIEQMREQIQNIE